MLISFSIFGLLAPAATHAKVFSAVIRNANGEVLHVTSFSASEYCISIGTRVPTVRELAEWGQQNGALGIRESAFAGTDFDQQNQFLYQEVESNRVDGYAAIWKKGSPPNLGAIDFY